jgi:hypothetical protein
LASSEISGIVVYAGAFGSKTKVDLDFSYLASFDGEELRDPGSAAIRDFAVVEDEGFVRLFKYFSMPWVGDPSN